MYYKKSSIFCVSVDESSNYLIIKKIIVDYYKQNGCYPTIEEINSISGLCINDIKNAINCYQLLSLEKIDKEKSYYDYELPILDREEAQEFCEFCINNLTPEEAWYVEYMYGFFDNGQKTIKETADHFYKNEDYVESKINKSLKKMRNFYKKIL